MQSIKIGNFKIIFSPFNMNYIEIETLTKKVSLLNENDQIFINNILLETEQKPQYQPQQDVQPNYIQIPKLYEDPWPLPNFDQDAWKSPQIENSEKIEEQKKVTKRRTPKKN